MMFSSDVCPKTMRQRPCWCSKPVLWELNTFNTNTNTTTNNNDNNNNLNIYRIAAHQFQENTAINTGPVKNKKIKKEDMD